MPELPEVERGRRVASGVARGVLLARLSVLMMRLSILVRRVRALLGYYEGERF